MRFIWKPTIISIEDIKQRDNTYFYSLRRIITDPRDVIERWMFEVDLPSGTKRYYLIPN
jgi:hypothetical protein